MARAGQAGDMGGCLACAEEVAVGIALGAVGYRLSGVRADDVGFDSAIKRRPLAAERLDYGSVEWVVDAEIPSRCADGEQSGICALGGVADAVVRAVVLQRACCAPDEKLNPGWRSIVEAIDCEAVHAIGDVAVIERN